MPKKKVEKPQREFTKRQLSRWQKQKRRQRIIFVTGISIIVAVLVTVGVGWYIKEYQPLNQTVIKVNDTEFDMNYYVKMLRLYGKGQTINFMYAVADQMVTTIERNEIVRQGAMKLGISVSNDAVDDELKNRDPPLTKDYRDLVRAEMLINQLRDEYFDQKVPVFAEQRHIMAMFLESESQAGEVRARLENGEDFAELAGELSLESLSKSDGGDFGWKPKGILATLVGTSVLDEYAFSSEMGVLSPPVYDETKIKILGYWLIKVSEQKENSDEAHVQAILLGSAQEAQMVKDKLDAGEDFATLASELSQHGSKENGGDLGWLAPGMMPPAFDEFAFDSEVEIEKLSEPIRDEAVATEGGYWLVRVLDVDDYRKIEDEDRNLMKAEALNEWVSSLWDDPENEIDDSYLTPEKKAWAVQRVTGG